LPNAVRPAILAGSLHEISKGEVGMMATNDYEGSWLPQGTPVQVRDRFEFAFRSGFDVSETTDAGYRLRRRSDGVVLPVEFSVKDVRRDSNSLR
jgi:hypothetical protein